MITDAFLSALPLGSLLAVIGGFWSFAWWQLDYTKHHRKPPSVYETNFFILANSLLISFPVGYISTLVFYGFSVSPSDDPWLRLGELTDFKYTSLFHWLIFGINLLTGMAANFLGAKLAQSFNVGKKPQISQELLEKFTDREWEPFLD
ncbi:MAG: hypothetical protein SFT81_01145 [Candidatus Caenarcaniphilales bacterium]|nr:hypothetical protein [Candidatus Caenarcaniphilales bacterium]